MIGFLGQTILFCLGSISADSTSCVNQKIWKQDSTLITLLACYISQFSCLHQSSQSSLFSHLFILHCCIHVCCHLYPKMGYTPLLRSASQGAKDTVQVLLDSGCDINVQDEVFHGWSFGLRHI